VLISLGFHESESESESELLYDCRFTANQFILALSPLRPATSIFFQLNTCGYSLYITSSLTRGWVCRLQLLLVFAKAVIVESESCGTHDHILLSHFRDCPNLDGQVPVFISPRYRVAQLYPQGLGSISSPPTTRRATVEVFEPASTQEKLSVHKNASRLLLFRKIIAVYCEKHPKHINILCGQNAEFRIGEQKNMVMGSTVPETKNDCAGEGQHQIALPDQCRGLIC
jgi:hypothetical protein